MAGFTVHQGKMALYLDDHIDTDRIIPARFLSMVTRDGYGDLLFHDIRGTGCPLDEQNAQGATVLVAGTNFGCGSSREHAVWAIQQAGFVAVIAKTTDSTRGFSDIFRQNAANCGLLLIDLPEPEHQKLGLLGQGAAIEIDLPSQTLRIHQGEILFEISPSAKEALISGLDLIGTTLLHQDDIAAYEAKHPSVVPQLP